ncbi:MAG: co-chaperone GroES [Erysipelotrichaceae bacterium]|nr:co-chaperone GroES [Erysipelotrichaceae bacterium]
MIRPLNDNVLLKKETVENKTASGIILSANEKDAENIGVVIAVGDGKEVDGKKVPVGVKAGEKVIFDKYSTTEIEYDKEKYLLISDSKILAVIE